MQQTLPVIRLLLVSLYLFSAVCLANYRVLMEPSPPFQFIVDNEIRGSVVSNVRAKFKQAQIDASFEIYPWTRALSIASKEKNAFISNIARTPERENNFKWVAIVHSFEFALIAVNELIYAESLEDAKQYTIAVQRNDIAHLYLKKMGFSEQNNLFITADITESWRLLNKEKVDFLVEDIAIIEVMARDYLTNGKLISHQLPLPELQFDTWLAANPGVDDAVLQKLMTLFN